MMMSTMEHAKNISTGFSSTNISCEKNAINISTGDSAINISRGNFAKNLSTGKNSTNVSEGDGAINEMFGEKSLSVSMGEYSLVKGVAGCAFSLSWRGTDRDRCFVGGVVGNDGIKENTWYHVIDGTILEVQS